MGPLLFIIFANSIANVLRNSHIIKWADGIILFVAGNNIKIIQSHLSDDLNLSAEWFKKNELIRNLKKRKIEPCSIEV